MDFEKYKEFAKIGILEPTKALGDKQILIFALGLGGECGEVEDLVKKGVGHGKGINNENLTDELGDVMWYIANICNELGITMDEILAYNMKKLQERYPTQYSQPVQPNGCPEGPHNNFVYKKNGPHMEKRCAECGHFFKFLNQKEKEELINGTTKDVSGKDELPWD